MNTKIRTKEFNKELKVQAIRQLTEYASFVQRRAKQIVSVDTGQLRSSIGIEINENNLSAKVGTNVNYAEFVEFGTYASREPIPFDTHTQGMKPRPYLRPALDELRTRMK